MIGNTDTIGLECCCDTSASSVQNLRLALKWFYWIIFKVDITLLFNDVSSSW